MGSKKSNRVIKRTYLMNLILGFVLLFFLVFSFISLFDKVNYILISITILILSFIVAWNVFVFKEKIKKKKVQRIGFAISSLFFLIVGFLFGVGILKILGV